MIGTAPVSHHPFSCCTTCSSWCSSVLRLLCWLLHGSAPQQEAAATLSRTAISELHLPLRRSMRDFARQVGKRNSSRKADEPPGQPRCFSYSPHNRLRKIIIIIITTTRKVSFGPRPRSLPSCFLFSLLHIPSSNHLGITLWLQAYHSDLHSSLGWLCRRASLQLNLAISYRLVFLTTNELRCSGTSFSHSL